MATNYDQESLGTYLKRVREEKGVSIEQVAYATRISLKMLSALEEDDHSALPAPTFVRGYLQAYAKYIHIDTQDLLLRYQHHLAVAPDTKRANLHSHYLYANERHQEKQRFVLVIVLFVTMLSVAGTYFLLKSKRERNKRLAQQAEQIQKSDSNTTVTSATATPEKSEEKKDDKNQPEKKEVAKEPEKPAAAPATTAEKTIEPASQKQSESNDPDAKRKYNLLVRAEEDVWLRFQTDEEEVRDLTLRSGKALMLRADKVIKIFSGNLGALKAKLNGKELATLTTPDRSMSAVLPESEVANYPLPLFPQFQKNKESGASN